MKRSEFYSVSALKDNVYRIESRAQVFCELLIGEKKALLIDSGYGIGDLAAAVKGLTGDKELILVSTHGHVDHTSGSCQFHAPLYLAEEDFELCRQHNGRKQREFTIRNCAENMDYMTHEITNILPEDFDSEAYLSAQLGQLLPLEEGMVFDLGGITVEAIKTPGHTKGGMSFYYREENWLYAGDAFGFFLWLFDEYSTDRAAYIAGLDKAIHLAPDKIWGGHNPAPMSVENLKLYRRAAVEADFDKGEPFSAPILEVGGKLPEIRACAVDGMTMADFGKPGFACVVIDRSR